MKFEYLNSLILLFLITVTHATVQTERFAIISGVNNGGQERQVLRYAVDDALVFSNVMHEMGGLTLKNTILLKNPGIVEFNDALHKIDHIIKSNNSGLRKELIIYYSGHADEHGLLFGNQCFDYRNLRKAIDSIGSDVKITILDACASGSITRIKGGERKKAFLVDASSNLTGYAFITSSSEQEVSQESDKIKGSFFTHFLVSGLRGAADMSNDGKITLSEAYQFAFHETLAGTESTINGPQHPAYDMRLTGTGDVVMTDIRNVNSVVTFPAEMSGRIFVRSADNKLIAELMKQKGKVIEIGIPDGELTVQLYNSNGNFEGNFKATDDTVITVTLDKLHLNQKTKTINQKKGNLSKSKDDFRFIAGVSVKESSYLRGISLSLLSNITYDTLRGFQYSFFSNEACKSLSGWQLSLLGTNYCKESVNGIQLALISNNCQSTLSGSQLSLFRNISRKKFNGVQISAGINVSCDTFQGLQSSLISITNNSFCGLQLGIITFTHNINGSQISPFLNVSKSGVIRGAQISGLLNISKGPINGVQLSPLFNYSEDVKGVQIGLVNRSDTTTGAQIGLVNISNDMHGYPIGLFNYSKKGVFAFCMNYDEQSLFNFSLQSGTRHFYNIFTAATSNNGTQAVGLGTGYRIPLKYMSIENDFNHFFTFKHLIDNKEAYDITEKVRLSIGTRFIPIFSILAGLSYNILFNYDRDQNVNLNSESKRHFKRIDQGIYCWPGFHLGISVGRF